MKPNISFEFFPPKTPEGIATLTETAKTLSLLKPDFFSVTFGAGGSTQKGTEETVINLHELTRIETVPHLSCIGNTKAELTAILKQYASLGIKSIVALRGDLPSGMGHAGELRYADELVTLIRSQTGDQFHLHVAAYPELHPEIKNPAEGLVHFKRKVDAGANSAITQYFFNPDAYFYFVDACAKLNISIPIVPGIMPITNFARLARFSQACGAEIPRWIGKHLEAYEHDHESLIAFGIEVIYKLCRTLLERGAPGLHFYTLNHAKTTLEISKLLKFI